MIYESFMFFNELELLDVHLNAHNDHVDKFIITECTITFSGNPKPLYYKENKHLFEKFNHKIIHVVVDKFPDDFPKESKFVLEPYYQHISQMRDAYQRIFALRTMKFNDDDIIILTDADEILDFTKLQNINKNGINAVKMKNYYYYINNLSSDDWEGVVISNYKTLMEIINSESYISIRSWSKLNRDKLNYISNYVGWHFGYLGKSEDINYKIESASHPEFDTPEIKNNVQHHIDNNTDLLNRAWITYRKVPFDDSFPDYIVKNRSKFSHFIYDIK